MPHFGQAVKTRIWILLDEICLVLQCFNLLGGRLWTFLEGGLVRKEDSKLRANALSPGAATSPPPNSSATSEPAMPQRVRDVFAWIRLFMNNGGPPATTRLVLFAHSLFMDRDGSHCRGGVRRLADITGLDKTTVAQHRAAAIKRGWPRSLSQGCPSR